MYNFRNHTDKSQILGERETPTGQSLYLARPIQIANRDCLTCHSTVEVAPKTMIDLYGPANGFGWKHNEIVGAQIVSVPMSVPIQKAMKAFYTFMGSLLGVFVLFFVVLNLMLNAMVIKPLTRMAELANAVSTGHLELPEFPVRGEDEVSVLGSVIQPAASEP